MRSRMWLMLLVMVQVMRRTMSYTSPNMYCADLNPQNYIDTNHLMGMWFAIEVISHQPDDEFYVRRVPTCPIIHISEDRTMMSTTNNPLYRDYGYDSTYGQNYDYNYNYRTQAGRNPSDYATGRYPSTGYPTTGYPGNYPGNNPNDMYGGQYGNAARSSTPYSTWFPSTSTSTPSPNWYTGSSTAYPTNLDFNRLTSGVGRRSYVRHPNDDWRYLRLWWDEDGTSTEYNLRYNVTRAGFWYSSGPNNGESDGGSSLSPQYNHFAGTVQVVKAVGDHIVLTFCHSLPERKLFTVILSRENYLDYATVHGVHNLLLQKNLRTDNIQKTCGASGLYSLRTVALALVLTFIVHTYNSIRY